MTHRLLALLIIYCSTMGAACAREAAPALHLTVAVIHGGHQAADKALDRRLAATVQAMRQRTAVDIAAPQVIDAEAEPLHRYPIIAVMIDPPPPAATRELLYRYMHAGGMLWLFAETDAADPSRSASAAAQRAAAFWPALPPLAPLNGKHVLNRSFYRLKPEETKDTALCDDEGDEVRDTAPCVLSILRPQLSASVLRLDINTIMYALTGNYKDDLIHSVTALPDLTR